MTAHAPQPNPEIATMTTSISPTTTAKLTLQTPAETALWTDLVLRLSRTQSMECAIEDADLAVLALRERLPSATAQPALETLSVDAAARLHMHALMVRAQASGAQVLCTMLDGSTIRGMPVLDWRPYAVDKRWLSIELQGMASASERIVKVEIL